MVRAFLYLRKTWTGWTFDCKMQNKECNSEIVQGMDTFQRTQSLLFSDFLTYATPAPRQTFPEPKFFVTKVSSVVPFGPGPTSQIEVSSASPGFTGLVNRTEKYLSAFGSFPPTADSTERAAKPYVLRPWRMTPPNPAACPILGSMWSGL